MSDTSRVVVDAEVAAKFTEWLAAGRGILRWTNQEIGGSSAREVFTPGDHTSAGWRYAHPEAIAPIDVDVSTPTELSRFRGRFKAHYWGPGVATATETKADRIVKSYNDSAVYWTWNHDPDLAGYVQVRIMRESITPFRVPLSE